MNEHKTAVNRLETLPANDEVGNVNRTESSFVRMTWSGFLVLLKNFRAPIIGTLGAVVAILSWEILATSHVLAIDLPTPGAVAQSILNMLETAQGRADIIDSTRRVVISLAIGISLAIPVAFVLARVRLIRELAQPLLNFFRALPPIALIPLVILYLGIGTVARDFVISWSVFFVSTIILYEGLSSIDPLMLRAAVVLGANRRELFFHVILPLAVPEVLTAARVGLGVGWGTLVAAELIAAKSGLGALISNSANYFDFNGIYAGIVVIGLIAVIMDVILRAATKRLTKWQETIRR